MGESLFGQFVRSLRKWQGRHPARPTFEETLQFYTPSGQPLTQDAAFSSAEEFAFLLGEKIRCPSWITAAQYDPESRTLVLWTEKHGPYDFPGVDVDGARLFARADSKGAWYWGVYKGRATAGTFPRVKPGRPAPEKSFGRVGVPTPLYRTVIRKR